MLGIVTSSKGCSLFNELSSFKEYMLVFSTQLWSVAALTLSLVQLSPAPLFPVWISIQYTRKCVRGVFGHRREGGLRQINTRRKVPLQINFLYDDILHCLLWILSFYGSAFLWRMFTWSGEQSHAFPILIRFPDVAPGKLPGKYVLVGGGGGAILLILSILFSQTRPKVLNQIYRFIHVS